MDANGHSRSILVCDSDLLSVRTLRTILRDAGFHVCVTQTAEDALARAALRVPDLLILELSLVDSAGRDVCRLLREWSSMPIIIVSDVSDEDRVVDAFQAGANDYIIKPLRPREFVARVEMHLERTGAPEDDPVIVFGGLQVDLAARVVRREGHEVRLTPIEYKLLRALVHNRGRLLTHDTMLQSGWGAAYAEDRQTLRAHMANLRRKLGSGGATGPIRTYPGVGYLFDSSTDARPSTLGDGSQLRPGARAA